MIIPEWLAILLVVVGSLVFGWILVIIITFSFILIGAPEDAHDIDMNDPKKN